jgi:hypothetical protein
MSSQAFHRTPGGHVRETTAGEQFEPRILKSFDSTTQEQYRLPPANNSHHTETIIGQEQNPPAHTG